MSETKPKAKSLIKFPIGLKLITMMAFMLLTATMTVVFLATKLFIDDTAAFIQKQNSDVAAQLANQTHDYLGHLVDNLTTMTEFQAQSRGSSQDLKHQFDRSEDILGVSSWGKDQNSPLHINMRASETALLSFVEKIKPSPKAWAGEVDIQRTTINGRGVLTLSFPTTVDSNKKVLQAAVGLINQNGFVKIYGKKGVIASYLVDREGNVLAHPKENLVSTGANLKEVSIVKAMLESTINNNQMRFIDQDNKAYLGAFRQVGVGGVGVISQVLEEKAFETANRVKYRSLLVSGIILFLAFGIVYFFSTTLTKPLRVLVHLTREIANGNFKVSMKPKGHDEITELSASFTMMAQGLAEREKLRDTFNKFHSKEIAEKILSGEIKLGGTRQEATIFFSDIRSFTSISENMEAEEVVEMLNEYMTAMVSEITLHKGVVDKYVGDAIMAVWGAPVESPTHAWDAVRASIAMRRRLEKFNEIRKAAGKNPLCIGMGLHSGSLIAGNIGSVEKMEYTVIGDTVNTASRIESLTKEFGTDMLISESVYEKVKEKVIVESVSASVKGKSKALTAYKVKGYIDEAGNKVIVETPYSTYESGHSDKVVHEKKKTAA